MREAPAPGEYNHGQYQALCDAQVSALFVGHEHMNTYEFELPGTDLVCSPCTGFGFYGDIDQRGARVIILHESDLRDYKTHLATYQDFYGANALRRARLSMYQDSTRKAQNRNGAVALDWLFFKPLLWVSGLFA